MSPFERKQTYNLDVKTADQMLQNVFNATGAQPNTIPFEKLLERKKTKITPYLIAKYIALVALIFTLIMPLIFYYEKVNMAPPAIIETYKQEDLLWIKLSKAAKCVDYNKCYAKNNDGDMFKPSKYDDKNNSLAFETNDEALNIYILNYAGDVTHAVYTPIK